MGGAQYSLQDMYVWAMNNYEGDVKTGSLNAFSGPSIKSSKNTIPNVSIQKERKAPHWSLLAIIQLFHIYKMSNTTEKNLD